MIIIAINHNMYINHLIIYNINLYYKYITTILLKKKNYLVFYLPFCYYQTHLKGRVLDYYSENIPHNHHKEIWNLSETKHVVQR
jgi:hypothetical protein